MFPFGSEAEKSVSDRASGYCVTSAAENPMNGLKLGALLAPTSYSKMTSRLVPPLYPPPGTSAIADAIRVRRGPARGLSPLDGTLLQIPAFAEG